MKQIMGFLAAFWFLMPLSVSCSNVEIYRLLNLFGDVFARARSDYVEEVADDVLIENALNGMLSSLDPHSVYMNEKEFQEMQELSQGKFGGVGVEITLEHGVVKVISPVDDTPAFKAGIQPGDYFVEIDGTPIMGQTLNEVVEKLRGEPGTTVRLKVFREGSEAFDISIVREHIEVEPVRWYIEENIGVIRISTFLNEKTTEKVHLALHEIQKKLGNQCEGIIIDLRNNPGGFFDQGISVADLFLDKKEVVSTRGRVKEREKHFYTQSGDEARGLPLVVLINNGTASTSEILAGALQHHKRAIVLGTRSFGKGSVQTLVPLASGLGAIRLTTDFYYTPGQKSIQAEGIQPDIYVPPSKVVPLHIGQELREENIPKALKAIISQRKKENPASLTSDMMVEDEGILAPPSKGEKEPAQKSSHPDGEGNASEGNKPMKPLQKGALSEEKSQETLADESFYDYQLQRAKDLLHGVYKMGAALLEAGSSRNG